jgi:hypothetical protein
MILKGNKGNEGKDHDDEGKREEIRMIKRGANKLIRRLFVSARAIVERNPPPARE